MNKLILLWRNLRESFWFLPSLIVASSMVLALGLIEVDSSGSQDWMVHWPRLFGVNAEASREMLGALQTIASLTDSPSRRGVLREQAECIAELAGRSIESPHDRARFDRRLVRVREALETKPLDQPLPRTTRFRTRLSDDGGGL